MATFTTDLYRTETKPNGEVWVTLMKYASAPGRSDWFEPHGPFCIFPGDDVDEMIGYQNAGLAGMHPRDAGMFQWMLSLLALYPEWAGGFDPIPSAVVDEIKAHCAVVHTPDLVKAAQDRKAELARQAEAERARREQEQADAETARLAATEQQQKAFDDAVAAAVEKVLAERQAEAGEISAKR